MKDNFLFIFCVMIVLGSSYQFSKIQALEARVSALTSAQKDLESRAEKNSPQVKFDEIALMKKMCASLKGKAIGTNSEFVCQLESKSRDVASVTASRVGSGDVLASSLVDPGNEVGSGAELVRDNKDVTCRTAKGSATCAADGHLSCSSGTKVLYRVRMMEDRLSLLNLYRCASGIKRPDEPKK